MDHEMQWWSDFLAARTRALLAMRKEGYSLSRMVRTLNLEDEDHAARILAAHTDNPPATETTR